MGQFRKNAITKRKNDEIVSTDRITLYDIYDHLHNSDYGDYNFAYLQAIGRGIIWGSKREKCGKLASNIFRCCEEIFRRRYCGLWMPENSHLCAFAGYTYPDDFPLNDFGLAYRNIERIGWKLIEEIRKEDCINAWEKYKETINANRVRFQVDDLITVANNMKAMYEKGMLLVVYNVAGSLKGRLHPNEDFIPISLHEFLNHERDKYVYTEWSNKSYHRWEKMDMDAIKAEFDKRGISIYL